MTHLLLLYPLTYPQDSHTPAFETAPIPRRLTLLIESYLSVDILNDRLQDLSQQFQHPQPRPWQPIDWDSINPSQIRGIDPLIFLAILAGSIDTETPIRGYTQTSRQYLEPLYPQMARFVGGIVNDQGDLVELGLWEKEERQHSPALQRLYTQLSGLKLMPMPHDPRPYEPTNSPHRDLFEHGLHRVATEYGATCLYLWLMAHSTGALHTFLAELLIDEINHMTKFWGFGRWAYPQTSLLTLLRTLVDPSWGGANRQRSRFSHTLKRMMQVLHWEAWSIPNKLTLLWTFAQVLWQLWRWSRALKPEKLNCWLGPHPEYQGAVQLSL
ncbi:MAG: ferritin-like domain-containing protein [Acaryochloridaceae cyanobacterium CSU_3_4]|nr:ferritin-like domain-containing protein [Acaryochloridaceae cyanobacterium CSU_3_4]